MSRNTGSSLHGQKPSRMTAPTGSSALQGLKIGLFKSRTGIAEQVDAAADEVPFVSPTGIADDARGALVEAAAAAPVEEARRIVRKRHSAGLTLAAHVVSRGDDAEAATAAGPATVYSAENGAAPADNAQPATGTPLADAASATGFLHSRLLSSEIGRRFRSDSRFEDDLVEYQVAWEKPLGKGTFGTV